MATPNCNLKKFLLFYILFFFVSLGFKELYSQKIENEYLNFAPQSLRTSLSADGKIGFSKTDPAFGINQIRWNTYLTLKNNVVLGAEVKSNKGNDAYWYEFNNRTTKLSQLYLQYSNTYKVFSFDFTFNMRFGKLEYYPSYTEPQLILDNIDQYLNPPSFYGALLSADAMFWRPINLEGHFNANSSDIKNDFYKANINDAYLSINPETKFKLGARVSAGRIQGTKYGVNEAYLYYSPSIQKIIKLDARIGKLPGLDETPYGVRIGGEGYFKYFALGAYYERRINQRNDEKYIGFYWRIINPPELVGFLNSYQIIYDTNNDILRFNIPFLTLNIK
jgi:hypothetical protein